MVRKATKSMAGLTAGDFRKRLGVFGSRSLMSLTFLVIAVMPCTEYFWHFDQFLRGGQDFELSLLAILTVFCLALVLFQHGKKDLEVLVCPTRWLAFVFRLARTATPGAFQGLISSLHADPLPHAANGLYRLPLLI